MIVIRNFENFVIMDAENNKLARVNGTIFHDNLKELISGYINPDVCVAWEFSILRVLQIDSPEFDHLGEFTTTDNLLEQFSEHLI